MTATVLQCDREAAEPFRRGHGGKYDRDHERLTLAFARHRHDSTRDLVEADTCEACGRPIIPGHVVQLFDDVGEVHIDCDRPFAFSSYDKAMILAGDPMRLFPLATLQGTER